MFIVFDTLNLYTCVFMNCAKSCCLYDTLMDPWNIYIYIYMCVCVCVCEYMYICMYIHMYVFMCVCMYVCMYVSMSICYSSKDSPSARCVLSANLVCKDVDMESVLIYGPH